MAVENYINNITSSFGVDHNKIDCKVTRRLVVSLRKLSETKVDSSNNEKYSINSALNIQTKSNELIDIDKNLSAKIYCKSSLLNKDIKKSPSKIKSSEKQDIKTGIQFDTSLDNFCIDNFKHRLEGTELSVNAKQMFSDKYFALPSFTKFGNKTPIENHISDESSMEMEDQESALLYKLAMESESNFFQASDKRTDHESFISKSRKMNSGRIEDTSNLQVNTSSLLCKLKNSSTTSNIKCIPSKIKDKTSLSPKDQSIKKEMVVSSHNSKFKESSFLFKIKRQNIDYLDSCSTKITKCHEGNVSQTCRHKIIGMQSEAIVGIQNINEKSMNSNPVEDFKFAKMLPLISINSHILFSVIIVSFQSDGICLNFTGPEFETSAESHSVLLSDAAVEQLFIYCNKYSDAFISIVTSSAYGRYLRKCLKLNEKSIPSYSNDSKTKNQLKISFLMQNVLCDISNFICSIFSASKLNVIKHKVALKMLALSPFKSSSPEPTSCKLIYPAVGGIQVKEEDVAYLGVGKRINDTIIDFYLNYIYHEIIPAEFQARTHIFSSFFYKFLLRAFSQKHTGKNGSDVHRSVNKWIKNVDIFSKDFIFVPMNRRNHWYLVVICFLTQLNEDSYEEINLEDNSIEAKKSSDKNPSGNNSPNTRRKAYPYLNKGKPCVCFFDSLDKSTILKADKKIVAETLKRFLKMLWNTKNPKTPYDWEKLLCLKAVCPQQENSVDCGLYLLQYVESFFKNPIPYFGNPMPVLKNWFPKNCIIHKRTQIKKVISELRAKQPKAVELEPSCSSDVIALS